MAYLSVIKYLLNLIPQVETMSKHPVYPIHESRGFSLSALSARLYDHIQARLAHFTAVNELEGLTDRQLRDIGVNRHQIEQIAAREIARLHAK